MHCTCTYDIISAHLPFVNGIHVDLKTVCLVCKPVCVSTSIFFLLKQIEAQMTIHPPPLGMRPVDMNVLGIDLVEDDDEGSLEDSMAGGEGSLMDDSDSVQASGSVQPEDLDDWNIPVDDTANSEDTMNDIMNDSSPPPMQD